MRSTFKTEPGHRLPTGATAMDGGVNFSIYSRHATAVSLVLYERAGDRKPLQVIELDPRENKDYFHWHVFVAGAEAGLHYTWKVDGPSDPSNGFAFDADNELLDPWAREVSDELWHRYAATAVERPAIRARVHRDDWYDWEGDSVIARPINDEIIYEVHVRGFTQHPSSGVRHPGTFAGLVEKIPYLKMLGITAVELMPVMAFDPQDVPSGAAANDLKNYWGYSTYGFYALHPHYGATNAVRDEFRDLVKALHREGIAVILDVAFNHTAEGGSGGPIIHFKGLGNEYCYHLDPHDRGHYSNYSGCGNTVNCNDPFVADFILRCLEYWVEEMHIDGFRFDLASVFSRDENGDPVGNSRVTASIEFSPILSSRILIAEPWDAAGLHQTGRFPAVSWAEWNDVYRDTIRAFLKGDGGLIGQVATRVSGSNDLYDHSGRGPSNSVNFFACHDGFTLADLVSYDDKHNEANGEDNRDGHADNVSWNSGAEGETDDAEVLRLRERRARNFIVILMVSQGVPMIRAGDEVLRSQRGNNNAYCQDNEVSWLDWSLEKASVDMLRFSREMIAFRKRHPNLRRRHFIQHEDSPNGALQWSGVDSGPPDWHDPDARVLCFTLAGIEQNEPPIHVMINMSGETVSLPLPDLKEAERLEARQHRRRGRRRYFGRGRWRRIVDTSLNAPDDIVIQENAVRYRAKRYPLAAMSIAIFERY